jgi:hypothetical protein
MDVLRFTLFLLLSLSYPPLESCLGTAGSPSPPFWRPQRSEEMGGGGQTVQSSFRVSSGLRALSQCGILPAEWW